MASDSMGAATSWMYDMSPRVMLFARVITFTIQRPTSSANQLIEILWLNIFKSTVISFSLPWNKMSTSNSISFISSMLVEYVMLAYCSLNTV